MRFPAGLTAYGLWLDQKGRVLADSHVLRLSADEHLVFSARTPAPVLIARLEAYLVADEVVIEDATAQFSALGLWGDGFAALLGELGFSSADPAPERFLRHAGVLAVPAHLGREPGCWLLLPRAEADGWRARFTARGAKVVARPEAERRRLAAGIVAVPDDLGPRDLPNEGGLDATAISYTKGCYLGQEVMSRLKHLGQVRRRLFLLRGPGGPPAPRTPLYQGTVRVGETRSAAPDGDGFLAFALLSLVTLDRTRGISLAPGGAAEIFLVDSHG